MNRREYIQDELKGLNSSLPVEGNGGTYTVPEGYFEGFAASVLARIKAENAGSAAEEIAQLSPLLAGISRTMPYQVPDQYFQTNLEVLSAITSDNEESLVLSFIEKEMPYSVPQGYFFNLPEQVLEKVETQPAKVVRMSGRKWMRMAVAAMIAGIITISGIVYFRDANTVKPNDIASTQDLQKDLKKVSTAELNAFINSTVVTEKDNVTAQNNPKTNEVSTLLEDVSDKELDAFLDQVPTEEAAEEDIVL